MRKNYLVKLVKYMKNVYHIENGLNNLTDGRMNPKLILNDARRILKEDGVYDSNAKQKLMQYIKDAKQQKNGNGKSIFVKN